MHFFRLYIIFRINGMRQGYIINYVYIPNEQHFTNVKQINYNELVYGLTRGGDERAKMR